MDFVEFSWLWTETSCDFDSPERTSLNVQNIIAACCDVCSVALSPIKDCCNSLERCHETSMEAISWCEHVSMNPCVFLSF